jgi:hypothetical protein
MRNFKSIALITAVVLGASGTAALARPGGGPTGHPAGSAHSILNSNGPTSPDRDKGLFRAEERRSEEGAEHNQVGTLRSMPKKAVRIKNAAFGTETPEAFPAHQIQLETTLPGGSIEHC